MCRAFRVDDHAGVVFKVQHEAVLSAERLALANHNSGEHFFAKIGLTLLHRAHEHLADAGAGKPVEARPPALHGNDIQVLSTRVVGAVHHRPHGARDGHLVLGA